MAIKLKKEHVNKVSIFEKDIELKGYVVILKEGYSFLDGTKFEYVETQTELNDFMEMVTKDGK